MVASTENVVIIDGVINMHMTKDVDTVAAEDELTDGFGCLLLASLPVDDTDFLVINLCRCVL
jgi:hypothetical protein